MLVLSYIMDRERKEGRGEIGHTQKEREAGRNWWEVGEGRIQGNVYTVLQLLVEDAQSFFVARRLSRESDLCFRVASAVIAKELLSNSCRNVPLHSLTPHTRMHTHAGLLWSKQFYHYIVESWLEGDPDQPTPPVERLNGRNAIEWKHLFNRDVISMPDKWEYPWVRRGVCRGCVCRCRVVCVQL